MENLEIKRPKNALEFARALEANKQIHKKRLQEKMQSNTFKEFTKGFSEAK